MRILVCGSRHFDDWGLLCQTMDRAIPYELDGQNYDATTIIEGGAKGADFLARVWAKYMDVPFVEYPADWKTHGKAAGPIRNQQMLVEGKPDMVIAFLAPNSRGTKHMIEIAQKANIPVNIINIGVYP